MAKHHEIRVSQSQPKKRISARISIKRQLVQRDGFKMAKGYGVLRNLKKAAYNKVYNITSFEFFKFLKNLFKP